ncbi:MULTISPECIES: sigma-54-dependent Fis family transcriptional regulator [Sporomusa]|jgi:arginine utilization regulatory protein|uniref:sigma-54 interaction domain-containing protein n=1 Tax=Sporomusa TaxID=2375 RepID=UPI00166F5B6E|nr:MULTISPECIES: sigma 54-interacting transcriptional regulator [Sporomusa]HML33689.1 sigma 54-interacting transcriptional regulator [Sporomusa sphaeroides]
MTDNAKKSLEELRRENRLLHEIIDAISEGVYAADKDGTILIYNRAFERIEATERQSMLGRKDTEVYSLPPMSNLQRRAVLQSKAPLLGQCMTYQLYTGKKVDIVYNSYPFLENGEITAIYSINRDLPSINELLISVVNSFDRSKSKNRLNGTSFTLDDIIGVSQSIRQSVKQARKIAPTPSTVMIYGETGTGKELFAQGIHNASSYSARPFVAVNCAAIPETLMESLLLGTVKGAFTGAIDTPGLFEQAENGTLFLDEINSLSLPLQAKLLRLLQDKRVRRLGDKKERKINCRIISATNQSLYEMASKGSFREDLLYRLTPVILHITPLRERPEDIPVLAFEFISRFNKQLNLHIKTLSPELLELFSQYNWPGNIRELEHAIESAMSIVENTAAELMVEDLPSFLLKRMFGNFASNVNNSTEVERTAAIQLTEYLRQCETDLIKGILRFNNGNVSDSAKQLGISRQDLHYRLRKLGIKSATYKPSL